MKGIEWIKLATCMCEDEKMRLIDSMEERDPTHYVWIRLLLQAGKVNDNGFIYLKENIPYTKEMLSILFNRPVPIIERCLEILESFEMIEIYEDNIIRICNWEKHQNIEGMKRVREGTKERVRNHREKKKIEKELEESKSLNHEEASNKANNENACEDKLSGNKNCNANVTLQKEKREKDNKKKNKNIDKDERRGKENLDKSACNKNSEASLGTKNIDSKVEEDSKLSGNLDIQADDIIKFIETAKVSIKGLTIISIRDLLAIHKDKYVKMALEVAIERNKLDMNYVNGILKNWLNEGYPKTYEDMEFRGFSSDNLSLEKEKPQLRFNNFEPRKYDYDDLEKKLLGW